MRPRSEWKHTTPSRPRRWEVLTRLVLDKQLTRGVEIGIFDGRTTFYLLRHCPELEMVGVDLFEPRPEKVKDWESGVDAHLSCPFDQYYKDIVETSEKEFPGRVTVIKGDSIFAASLFEDNYFDFIFVDADHSYTGVAGDIDAWAPKVKPNGYITGHDIHFNSVQMAVEEFFGDNYETHTNSVWTARKADCRI